MNAEQVKFGDCFNSPIRLLPRTELTYIDDFHIDPRFKSEEEEIRAKDAEEIALKKIGMNAFPEDIYNNMLEYFLENKKYRDMLLLVCSANFGMRFSDVSRLKAAHLIRRNGKFNEKFYLSERKTGKERPFYVNEAVRTAMRIFWRNFPDKGYDDYLFTSESNHRQRKDGTVKPITHTSAENILKNTLLAMGVDIKNDPRCRGGEIKLNTHSLRKTYGREFHRIAYKLDKENKLGVSLAALVLLQNDYMHKSLATTQRYCEEMERAKQIIVNEMNIGLPVLRKYL